MPLVSLGWVMPGLSDSPVLGTVYLSLVEVRRHWIDSLFIYVILIYLDWIPVIEIVSVVCTVQASYIACFY